jgi:hypothetical protein
VLREDRATPRGVAKQRISCLRKFSCKRDANDCRQLRMSRMSQLAEFQVTNITEYVAIMRTVSKYDTFPSETLLTLWKNMLLVVTELCV